jgi:hypothetical protein
MTRARVVKHGKCYDVYKGDRWMGMSFDEAEANSMANKLNKGQRIGGVRGANFL